MTDFEQKVISFIRKVPAGKVCSYGTIAALAGSPRSALAVGRILRQKSDQENLPWQRVINTKGRISIMNMELPAELQAELLRQEGVKVELRNGSYWVDMNEFGWYPEPAQSDKI